MKKIFYIFITLFFLTIGIPISAQEININNDTNKDEIRINVEIADEPALIIDGNRITMPDAIKKALELIPDIYVSKYNAEMADSDFMQFQAKYSPVFNIQADTSEKTNPELFYSKSGKEIESIGTSTSLSKNFSTGTTVSAGVSYTYTKFNSGLGPKYDMNVPVVFATIEQELLKNSFGYKDRKQDKMLKNVTQMKREAHIYSMSMTTLIVLTDYWTMVIAQNHVDNSKLMLSETKKVRQIVAEKVRIGLSEQFEINYWDSQVAFSKSKVSRAEQNYRNALRKFFRDINLNENVKVYSQSKVVLSDKFPAIDTEAAIKTAFAKRVDYLNAVKTLENSKLALQIYQNNALPSLKGSVTMSQLYYNIDAGSGSTSPTPYTGDTKTHDYQAKLVLTYPLDDTNQKVNERNANFNVKQSKMKLDSTRRSVKDDVVSKIENINTTYDYYTNAKVARNQASHYYNKMLANLSRGRFAASSVRDALDGLVNCREMELQSLVAYNVSLIEFKISKNELFESYGIDIDKFIKETK